MKECKQNNNVGQCINDHYEKEQKEKKQQIENSNLSLRLDSFEMGQNMFKDKWFRYSFRGLGGMLTYSCRLYCYVDFNNDYYTIEELVSKTKHLLANYPK